MKTLTHWLTLLAKRQDIVLAIILVMAVFMIILPLPTVLIDVLIAVNLSMSLILLMVAIYVREPLEFSAFPAVLLITTLYRLSLSISTTRLILLQHDAGEIVYTFGNFVVSGNIGVGLIIFAIITIVQFIVITKGSERVAEVGARFSLDGMPGKQMSIDGDMRAGIIDAMEAKRQRSMVQKESQLYGAMDGAMKFVKGDAIASMIIVMVNIFGGVALGVTIHDMTVNEAIATYSILSIGDGLISQIPALLISITAGIIVTRVPGAENQNLASEITHQLGHQPKPLFLASIMLLLFAILPGFPTLIFTILALLLGGSGWMLIRGKKVTKRATDSSAPASIDDVQDIKPGSIPLMIMLPERLQSSGLSNALMVLRWQLFERLGVILPEIETKLLSADEPIRIMLYQEPIVSFDLQHDDLLLQSLAPLEHEMERPVILYPGYQVYLISEAEAVNFESDDIKLYRGDERLIFCLEQIICRYAKEFVGVQETRVLMDAMEADYSELVKELQRQLPLGKVADILQRLVEEGISIRDLRTIFESLIVWSVKEKDTVVLTEYVRMALRRHIIHRYQREHQWLDVWIIGSAIEEAIRESIRQTAAGAYSALEPDRIERIIEQITLALAGKTQGLLMTAIDVRRYLRKMVEREYPQVSVLSFQEVGDDVRLNVLGNIDTIGEERD